MARSAPGRYPGGSWAPGCSHTLFFYLVSPSLASGPHSFSLAPPSLLVDAPLRPSPGRRSRTLGIPAAGQHADGFAGPGELFEELSEGAPGGRGDTVLVHGEQAGDCSRQGARQPLSPARASAAPNRTPRPLRARQLAARGGRAGPGLRAGRCGLGSVSWWGARLIRRIAGAGASHMGKAAGGALQGGSTAGARKQRRWAEHRRWGRASPGGQREGTGIAAGG